MCFAETKNNPKTICKYCNVNHNKCVCKTTYVYTLTIEEWLQNVGIFRCKIMHNANYKIINMIFVSIYFNLAHFQTA